MSHLRGGRFNTSSQAYEVGLLNALAKLENLDVLCIGLFGARVSSAPITLDERLHYSSFGKLTVLSLVAFVRMICAKPPYRTVLLTTGYFPLEMLALLYAKARGLDSYAIIFDTHEAASRAMPWLKRLFANAYFRSGYSLARRLSGILVLNDNFLKKDRFKGRVLKTRIGNLFGLDMPERADSTSDPQRVLNIIFAGTLNADNGVDLILDALGLVPDVQLRLHFFGDGCGASRVAQVARRDTRVQYHGRVDDAALDQALVRADYLIALRDPDCIAAAYSFPSKLIKFMSSGTPVISNRFPGLDRGLAGVTIQITNYSAEAFAATLLELSSGADKKAVGSAAREFIEKNHNWVAIAQEIEEFLFRSSRVN